MKIPTKVYSQLGAVSVRMQPGMIEDKNENDAAFGKWNAVAREIVIDPTAADATQLITLFHEMVHVALWESGADNVIEERIAEVVCDAVGSYFAGATLNGFLTLKTPK